MAALAGAGVELGAIGGTPAFELAVDGHDASGAAILSLYFADAVVPIMLDGGDVHPVGLYGGTYEAGYLAGFAAALASLTPTPGPEPVPTPIVYEDAPRVDHVSEALARLLYQFRDDA